MFNTVIISGRLTAAPELKKTPNDVSVTSFTIANETGYGDNKKTNFLNCTAWRGTAETICKYFTKGNMIGLEGQIQTRKYQDKDGNNRTVTEIIVNNLQFMESKKDEKQTISEFEEMSADADELPF